jgi:beta-galactosidase
MDKRNFSRDWKFHLGDFEHARWSTTDVSNWRTLDLPHDWSIELKRSPENISGMAGGFFPMGVGWYHKTFTLPADWQEKKVTIEFEGVYMNAEVWLNQNLLGRHPYGYTSFYYDLTPYLKWESPNEIKVFVDNSHQLNSRWYSGSGIYRPVWLMAADPVHAALWGIFVTTPEISAETAAVRIETTVENETPSLQEVTVKSILLDPSSQEKGSARSTVEVGAESRYTLTQETNLPAPQLWSPDQPSLYTLRTEIRVDGVVKDTHRTTFGIRSIAFNPEEGFKLNGNPILLKGGCVHHDNGILGAASYAHAERRKVEIHKASGYNAIRCAHNPPAPAFLDACDRLGILVIDEAFDCWREGKNHGDYHVVFEDWWQRDLESMLYRDRNHPSIILWSIGNEVLERDGRGGGVEISRQLTDRVRAIDSTRPVTAAICSSWNGGRWEDMDQVFANLDIGGYNYQWTQYRPDHVRLPERIMMGTESFPMEAFENWMAVLDEPYVIGDFVWTSLDYLGESGIGRVHFEGEKAPFLGSYPWHQANCGDLDLCGFKRPQSYYRDVLWHDDPRLYIAVHTPVPDGKTPTITRWGWPDVWPDWNWRGWEGTPFLIDLYSNCDEVELFLNGRSLGIKQASQKEKHNASFQVSYEPGELKAIGYRNKKRVAVYSLRTAGSPAQIQLIPDQESIRVGGDLCYITVKILDGESRLHPKAENEVVFQIEGPGEILAVGNSNPVSEEPYTGNRRRAYRGRALLVVKSTCEPGDITLSARAEGLESADVRIKCREA